MALSFSFHRPSRTIFILRSRFIYVKDSFLNSRQSQSPDRNENFKFEVGCNMYEPKQSDTTANI